MKLTAQQEKDLAKLVPEAQAALASGDAAQAQKVVQDVAKIGGPELLSTIWKSGS